MEINLRTRAQFVRCRVAKADVNMKNFDHASADNADFLRLHANISSSCRSEAVFFYSDDDDDGRVTQPKPPRKIAGETAVWI